VIILQIFNQLLFKKLIQKIKDFASALFTERKIAGEESKYMALIVLIITCPPF